MKKSKYISIDKAKSLVACAYAKGVADGCNHMLDIYRADRGSNSQGEVLSGDAGKTEKGCKTRPRKGLR